MPSLGTVDALQPIAAAPPNLRDEMCGKHRKRPATEDEDDETRRAADVDPSSAYAVTLQSLRGARRRPVRCSARCRPSVPIPVSIGRAPSRRSRRASRPRPKREQPPRERPRRSHAKPRPPRKTAGQARDRECSRRRLQPTPTTKCQTGTFAPASPPSRAAKPPREPGAKKTTPQPEPKASRRQAQTAEADAKSAKQ